MHDLRGGITNCELGTHVLRATTLDQGGEALARILRGEDPSASSSAWRPAARSVESALSRRSLAQS